MVHDRSGDPLPGGELYLLSQAFGQLKG